MTDNNTQQSTWRAIEAYLQQITMMQLATASTDAKPWICNVWFALDNDLSLYWISTADRRHSREIEVNDVVAASFCLVNTPADDGAGAVQLEGIASRLHDAAEIEHALKLYSARGMFTEEKVREFLAHADRPHYFYKLVPRRAVLFDPTLEISQQEYVF